MISRVLRARGWRIAALTQRSRFQEKPASTSNPPEEQHAIPRKDFWLAWLRSRLGGGPFLEIGLIGLWAIWLGRSYLDFNPTMWPLGREFGFQLQSHHFWTNLKQCGLCAFWNGGINGGSPALAETYGSPLHPFIMIATLLWGTVIGAKIAAIAALWLAGIAQWWIARILGLGRVSRLWIALVAVAGGHIVGKLELPGISMVISTATSSLGLAAALHLGLTGRRRAAILLAFAGALTIVSGQGYMQIALLSWAPAFLILLLNDRLGIRSIWREYALAFGLSLLLAGVFLVPMLHYLPNYTKDGDEFFRAAQPLQYIPLNLVINDIEFLKGTLLGKLPYPYLYNLYIGWFPVLLAGLSLFFVRQKDQRILFTLICGAALMFFMASAIPFRWLFKIFPQVSTVRHTALIAGLAVPPILALAGYSLDRLLRLQWPQMSLRTRPNASAPATTISFAWLLAIPIFLSLRTVYNHAQDWLSTTDISETYADVEMWQTSHLQWVSPPYGEHFWVEPATELGVKLTDVVWPWHWKDNLFPLPSLDATRGEAPPNAELVQTARGISIYLHPDHHYAYVESGDVTTPCEATGVGGNLTIECSSIAAGKLIVQENAFNGWFAWRDGQRVPLLPGQFLQVDAPLGQHEYRFRYIPWDVGLGLLLTLTGLALAIYFWQTSPVPVGETEKTHNR